MGVCTDLMEPQDVLQSYRLETRDTTLLLVSFPLLPKRLHHPSPCISLLEPVEAGPSGPHKWSDPLACSPHPLLQGVVGMGGEAGLSPQALEFCRPRPCLHQLSDTGSRPLHPWGSAAHPGPHPSWLPRKENRKGSHQSGAQAGEPYQDKGHPSASGAKARTPRLTPVTTGSAQLTPLKPSAQNQGWRGWWVHSS